MSHRTATWLAWSMCALSLALTVLSLLLLAPLISVILEQAWYPMVIGNTRRKILGLRA
jgi:hypothetical protein